MHFLVSATASRPQQYSHADLTIAVGWSWGAREYGLCSPQPFYVPRLSHFNYNNVKSLIQASELHSSRNEN